MNSDEGLSPSLRPLQSLADFYEYLLNSQSFNTAIRLQGNEFSCRRRVKTHR